MVFMSLNLLKHVTRVGSLKVRSGVDSFEDATLEDSTSCKFNELDD